MEFAKLPEAIFLQIYRFLPLGDKIRLSRVNQNFHRISEKSISQNFRQDNSLENMNLEWFKKLINLCSNNLKRVNFFGYERMEVFSKLTYPRLDTIFFDGSISKEAFGQIFQNNKNLQQFFWNFLSRIDQRNIFVALSMPAYS